MVKIWHRKIIEMIHESINYTVKQYVTVCIDKFKIIINPIVSLKE